MPRRLQNPFSSSSMSERERRPSSSKGNRLSQLFANQKSKDQSLAQQTLLGAQQQGQGQGKSVV